MKRVQIKDQNGHMRNTSVRQFSVDFSDINDVEHNFNILKSQLAQLKIGQEGFVSRAERNRQIYLACCDIYNSDITNIYQTMKLDPAPTYYVYAHCDPSFKIAVKKNGKSTFAATIGLTNMPFYIGKGTGNRAYDLNRNDSHRKYRQKIKTFNTDIDVKIIRSDLTECEALMLESKLIDIFGLISFNGMLVNLDEGINSSERKKIYTESLHQLSKFLKNSV